MLAMNALPVVATRGQVSGRVDAPDWASSQGNLEDAKVQIDALKALVHDAVFLDEDAYAGAQHMSSYHSKLQAAHAQIKGMEQESSSLRAELARKDAEIAALCSMQADAEVSIAELKMELENNAVVFKMHYAEIMTRTEEVERLKTVLEGVAPSMQAQQPQTAPSEGQWQ
ncbi:hypothetical protein FOA52_014397 [Chlamydomonas sp. UWO 241]|nr:hypothetical protein FOA52_014397 [Chlamydomonas sp. UWO 241]